MKDEYQVVIVGAGITGAGIFRDLALHGVHTLIIDKNDFSSQTSQSSSKMLHGGIRYLENLDFSLVYEALHEKNLWLKLTPHLVKDQSFHLPIYRDSLRPPWMMKSGLFLYDLLSGFKNQPHDMLTKSETLTRLPELNDNGLKACGVYHDAIVEDAKLTLENIFDVSSSDHADAENYHSLEELSCHKGYQQLIIKNEKTGKIHQVKAKEVVFATGPFTDNLLFKLKAFPWSNKLLPSKGSHLWIDAEALKIQHPIVMTPDDGRVIFVIPQRGAVLVGTTEKVIDKSSFNLLPSRSEIDYLLKNLNDYFPKAALTENSILSAFAGIRPLVMEDGESDRGKTARVHKVYQPQSHIQVILGGKYTTFRVMAQDIVRPIMRRLNIPYNNKKTLRPLKYRMTVPAFESKEISGEDIERILACERPVTFDDFMTRRVGIFGPKHLEDLEQLDDVLNEYGGFLKKNLSLVPDDLKTIRKSHLNSWTR